MFRTYAQAGVTAGASSSPAAAASVAAPGGWHPTVLYMLALVIGEVLIAGFLSRHLLS